jgi:hypothetical protein
MRRLTPLAFKSAMAALILCLVAPLPAPGQAPGIVAWEARPGSGTVAVTVRFPVGALQDPAGAEGTAFLLGRVVEAAAMEHLGPRSASLQVDVGLHHLEATLFAPASSWMSSWAEVASLLSTASLPSPAVDAARARVLDEASFQEGSPERAFEAAWNGFRLSGLVPSGTSPSRSVEGRSASLARLDRGALEGWRNASLSWNDAVVAVVGDVSPADLSAMGGRRLLELTAGVRGEAPPAPDPAPAAAPGTPDPRSLAPDTLVEAAAAGLPLPPPPLRLGTPAPALGLPAGGIVARWSGSREIVDREITSTWMGLAWALPRGTPLVLRDFLAHVVGEALNPSPPDPNLYRARVTLEEVEGIPLLVVVAATDPQAAYAWEARILQALENLSEAPLPGAFLDLARRRYRSTRILEAADPALRSRWVASHLGPDGTLPSVTAESWGLRRSAVAALVEARGEPRILLKGPAAMMATP